MQINRPILRQQLPQKHQPLVHELQIVVVGPDVGVLNLLAEGVAFAVDLGGGGAPAQLHLAHVVGARIEGRVDVDELDLAAKAVGQQVPQNLLVVAVEEQAALGVGGGPIFPDGRFMNRP